MGGIFHNQILKGGGAIPPCRAEMPGFFHFTTKEVKITIWQTKVQSPGIEQGGPEAPPVPDAEKVPEQLETKNLTGPTADGQPEQAIPAEESKGELEKTDGKIIDITGKMT